MDIPTQGASGYYVWEAEGKSFEVHVSLDVIDGLNAEMMRGFGAVPKRGAEVGGLLLGSIERGDTTVVRIEDFEQSLCGYTRGPSFLLSEAEREMFAEAAESWRPDASRPSYAVGFYRSHTREGFGLASEDIELMDQSFSGPSHVALLVKPFATRASTAGFFFREEGAFQAETPMEFPFRRRELTGEQAPERRALVDRRPRDLEARGLARTAPDVQVEERSSESVAPKTEGPAEYSYATTMPARRRMGGWMWYPLSFVFLLFGVGLGALGTNYWVGGPRAAANRAPDYSLDLSVSTSGDNLKVQWNGESPAIRNADRGVMEVHDGGYSKTVDLDAAQLRDGKLAFHNVSDGVTFHLTVYINSRLSISETQDWHK